ncbi:MAG: ATP-binding protein [Lachnospiraceae bacterium]|nr:ATP-binding protein [Lachnospiraceae bacterium]
MSGKFSLRRLRSIKLKIFILLIVFSIVPLVILRYGILMNFINHEIDTKTIEITSQSKLLATHIASTGYLDDPTSEVINAELSQLSNLYGGRVMIVDKSYTIIKDIYQMDEGKVITSRAVVESFDGVVNSFYDPEYMYIGLTVPIIDIETSKPYGVLIVNVSSESTMEDRDYYAAQADLIMIIVIIVDFCLAIFFSQLLVYPINRLRRKLNERRHGIIDEELHVTGSYETEVLCEEINGVFKNMKTLDESRQEFVSNVSHELKTPITSMKVLADSLLADENTPAELYREFMQDIAQEIDRESQIINDLLSLVKMDKQNPELNIKQVNINELLEVILKRIKPIAEKADVDLILESFRPVTADIDEVKMSLAISNLVENAVKYNKEGGFVKVTLNADHQYFYLTVEDNGMGIPEDSLDHVFERFYRVDKSHSREIGGTGLGLAITKSSIVMHKGAIKVASTLGEGTTFSVRVPLIYIA